MIFADKLQYLRKKSGWSQEELAEQMQVTRQSVSKWEGAQAIPDLEKMLRLSQLFGVTTDYLLKDELEEAQIAEIDGVEPPLGRVSMEEASNYLSMRAGNAGRYAFCTFLFILSPLCLLLLCAASESERYAISEGMAIGIGMTVLLSLVAVATGLLLYCSSRAKPFSYLEKEVFDTEYGVKGMVESRKAQYQKRHTTSVVVGTTICILSIIPLVLGALVTSDDLVLVTIMVASLFCAGLGVVVLVYAGTIWASYEILLQEGDYTRIKKQSPNLAGALSLVYWLVAVALYLGCSFSTNQWYQSWIILVVAGVLYPALLVLIQVFVKKEKN